MTPDERIERGRMLCEKLEAEVRSIAPNGLECWSGCWRIVADADTEFVLSLTTWEVSPGPATRSRVREAYNCVLDAWRRATDEFLIQERTG